MIGIDKKHFATDRALTREDLIAIKAPVDEGGDNKPNPNPFSMNRQYSDHKPINPQYFAAMTKTALCAPPRTSPASKGASAPYNRKKP